MTWTRTCEGCGVVYETRSPKSRFHSKVCGNRARRGTPPPPEPTPAPESVVEATRAELDRAAKSQTALGRSALALAALLDAGEGPASGLAAVAKELRATLEVAVQGATHVDDPVDEVARKRAERQARARAGSV